MNSVFYLGVQAKTSEYKSRCSTTELHETCVNEGKKFTEVIGQQCHVNVQYCLIMIVVGRLFSEINFQSS